jgi:arylformamidase
MRAPRLLDVSVPLAAGVPTYPGNPEFELQPVQRIAGGGRPNVSRLVLGTHSATHVDAPLHFFDGADALALDILIGRTRVLEMPARGGSGAADGAPARVVLKR